MPTIHIDLDGMRCRRCVREATALLRDLPGVATVSADRSTGRVTVTGDLPEAMLLAAFASSAFTARIAGSSAPRPTSSRTNVHRTEDQP